MRYFISFSHSTGFGNNWFKIDHPLEYKDLNIFSDMLERNLGLENVVILFFSLIADVKETEETQIVESHPR
jgi:hypothetical protein